MKYKNNPQDLNSYVAFQKRQLELAKKTEKEARKSIIEANLETWINHLPLHLRDAKPKNLNKEVLKKISSANLNKSFEKRLIISSSINADATFTAYSIIYGLISVGIVTPSEIRKTNLIDGYNNINGMFKSRDWKDYFFDYKAKVLLIETSSKSLTLMGPKGEEQFWKELDAFTINNDKLVIVTYNTDKEEESKNLFIPLITSDTEMNTKIIKKSVFIPLSQKEKTEDEQREIN